MKKAYLGIKYHSNHSNKSKIESISSLLEECGYSVTCITRDIEKWGTINFSPQELMNETFKIIGSSDVAIIELTEKGVGLGIEAGYAYSKNIPVITVSHNQEISVTLSGISKCQYVYKNNDDLLNFLKLKLK